MSTIIHEKGDVQENTPYTTNEELQNCGLSDWRIATDDEVITYNSVHVDEIKELKKANLQSQIDELDKKRIRAIAEPSLKDENTTWLEYYNTQIIELRAQIINL